MPTNRKNTSRRSASAGTPSASPPGTRSRVAEAARRTNNPDSRDQVAIAAATNPPPEAGDAPTGVDSVHEEELHSDSESDSLSSISDDLADEVADSAAADAAASIARTDERLADFDTAHQAPSQPHAASQFAARGIQMLGPSQGSLGTDPASIPGEPTMPQSGVSRGHHAPLPHDVVPRPMLPARMPQVQNPEHWTPANGYGRRPYPAMARAAELQ